MITPLPGSWAEKPGSASLPFFGVVPVILDPESGKVLEGEAEGVLCIKQVLCASVLLSQGCIVLVSMLYGTQMHMGLIYDKDMFFCG